MSDSTDLLVLGAGPAGLAAAWRAARRGLSVVVLDRADRVGGMAASFTVAGMPVDFGSHRLHPATPPPVLADIRELLGDDLQMRPRNGRLRIADRWVGFPLRAAELARALPPGMVARVARDSVTGPLRKPQTETYAGVLRASLGPTLYEAMYAPYAHKMWGADGERLDAEQARRRVTADTPLKIAARIVRRRRDGQGRVFWYPRRGFGQIVAALADAAAEAGAEIRLGAAVTGVSPGEDGVTVETADGGSIDARHLFTTVPLPVLARLCRDSAHPPPPAVLAAARDLRFRAMTLVYVVHDSSGDGGRWTPYDAHYLPSRDTPITRISEPANYRSSSDDPSDGSVLCCEIPCAPEDEVWTADEDALASLVTDGLARMDLPPVRVSGIHVERLRQVYPIYDVGYTARLAALDLWAGDLPRVTSFGRLGLFAHDNTHHAIVMAYDAVDALRDGVVDRETWSAARKRFAEHVVED